jgi:predicted ATPase
MCGDGIELVHVLALMTSLVDKCLVQVDAGTDRFRLHETMRAHGGDALAAIGATAVVRDRHLRYFTDLAKAMEPKADTSEVGATLAALERRRHRPPSRRHGARLYSFCTVPMSPAMCALKLSSPKA